MNKFLNFIVNGIKRFKTTSIYILLIFISTITLIITNNYDLISEENINIIEKISICLSIGFLISFGIELYYEKIKIKKIFNFFSSNNNYYKNYYILQLIGLIYIIIFGTFIDLENIIIIILNYFTFSGIVFFLPYFRLKNDIDKYYNFINNIFTSIIKSGIYSLIILIGGYLGILAVVELFDIGYEISDVIYPIWLSFSFIICFLGIILCDLKKTDELYQKDEFNKFINLILKNLLTGFITLYFLILYSYSIKSFINIDNWESGIMPWLIIFFSIIGYIGYIFTKQYEEESKFIKSFRKILPIGILVQTIILFYVIYVRIYEYSLTINRYFVVVFGIYLFIISIYFIISKRKNIAIIPGLISLLSIIISIGPWGVNDLPNTLQYNKIIKNLEINGLYQDGKVKKSKNQNSDINEQIKSQIHYLCENGECEKVKNLFSNYLFESDFSGNDIIYNDYSREIIKALEKRLFEKNIEKKEENYEYFILSSNQDKLNIEIDGYKKIIEFGESNSNKKNSGYYNDDENIIYIYDENGIISDKIDINPFIIKLKEYYDPVFDLEDINQNELTYTEGNYKIIFNEINIKNENYIEGKNSFRRFSTVYGYILIK